MVEGKFSRRIFHRNDPSTCWLWFGKNEEPRDIYIAQWTAPCCVTQSTISLYGTSYWFYVLFIYWSYQSINFTSYQSTYNNEIELASIPLTPTLYFISYTSKTLYSSIFHPTLDPPNRPPRRSSRSIVHPIISYNTIHLPLQTFATLNSTSFQPLLPSHQNHNL